MIAMLAMIGLGSPASAAPGPGQKDAPSVGSLTIHKYSGTPSGDANDGTELNPAPGRQPIAGVEFTVKPVTSINGTPVDLTTPAGWDKVADYTAVPPNTGDFLLGDATTVSTTADGSASLSDLPLGLYLVQETGNGGHNITQPAQDFLVTLPFPQNEDGWNYNVHVYPKNTIEGKAVKDVDDSTAQAEGDEITWTVTAPALGAGQGGRPMTSYVMNDNLDNRLQFLPKTVVVSVNGTAVDPDLYGIDHRGGQGGALNIAFNAAGLKYLDTLPADAVVSFAFNTEVHGIGVIPNDATIIVGDGNVDSEYPTEPVSTPWGAVIINKTDKGDSSALSGATFEVYDNAAGTGKPISVEVNGTATTEFTTAADGTATIPGLKAGQYWLKETVAPSGYVLPTDSFPVKVIAGETAELSTVTSNITNQQQSVPELPLTGANGQLLMIVAGIALLLVATGLVVLKRRRTIQQ